MLTVALLRHGRSIPSLAGHALACLALSFRWVVGQSSATSVLVADTARVLAFAAVIVFCHVFAIIFLRSPLRRSSALDLPALLLSCLSAAATPLLIALCTDAPISGASRTP